MSSNKSSMKREYNRIKRKSTGSRTCNVKFIDGNDPSSYSYPVGGNRIFVYKSEKYYEDVPPPRPPSLIKKISESCLTKKVSEPCLTKKVSEPCLTKKVSEPCLTKKLSEPLLTKKLSEKIIKFVK